VKRSKNKPCTNFWSFKFNAQLNWLIILITSSELAKQAIETVPKEWIGVDTLMKK
jgi:hypothetical protein